MITLPDRDSILEATLDESLPTALQARLQRIASNDELLDLTCVAIIEAGDSEQDIVNELGWSPLIHPIDEIRFDQPGFEPYWAHLHDHGGWFELAHPVGNDGFAYVLLIEDAGGGDLQRLCRRYAA